MTLTRNLEDVLVAGRYRLGAPLGDGAMGTVHTATHLGSGRVVAIKLMQPERRDARALARFEREVRAVGALSHPNVVEVLDCGHDTSLDAPFLVQPLVHGPSLRQRLDATPILSPELAVAIALPVLRALEAAHAAGIVHRDCKPSNVLLDTRSDGPGRVRPVLIDFGVSKLLDTSTDTADLTESDCAIGTPHYMAPEQASGAEVDARCDVWAVGVMLYEMLAGRRPFSAGTRALVLVKVLSHEPLPLEAIAPSVPSVLGAVVMRALAKDPALRWESARALHEALCACVDLPVDVPWFVDNEAITEPTAKTSISRRSEEYAEDAKETNVRPAASTRSARGPWLALAAAGTVAALGVVGVAASRGAVSQAAEPTRAEVSPTVAPREEPVEPPQAAPVAVDEAPRAEVSAAVSPAPRRAPDAPPSRPSRAARAARRVEASVPEPEPSAVPTPRVGARGAPILGAD